MRAKTRPSEAHHLVACACSRSSAARCVASNGLLRLCRLKAGSNAIAHGAKVAGGEQAKADGEERIDGAASDHRCQ